MEREMRPRFGTANPNLHSLRLVPGTACGALRRAATACGALRRAAGPGQGVPGVGVWSWPDTQRLVAPS
jgi:hypothetical protein